MNQVGEFLEAEQEKKMRIPVPPEIPELRTERHAVPLGAFFRTRSHNAKHRNQRGHDRLHANQLPRVLQIPREDENHRARQPEVAECDPLKCTASRPNSGAFLSYVSFAYVFFRCRQSQSGKTSCRYD